MSETSLKKKPPNPNLILLQKSVHYYSVPLNIGPLDGCPELQAPDLSRKSLTDRQAEPGAFQLEHGEAEKNRASLAENRHLIALFHTKGVAGGVQP